MCIRDRYGGTPVVYDSSNTQFTGWRSAQSHMLFEPTQANKALLVCDWDDQQVCPWKGQTQFSEYYRWETGPNNQALSLIDSSNQAIRIDEPRQVRWTVPAGVTSNSGISYTGARMILEYNGPGSLYGFPEFCQDRTTGKAADCSTNTDWLPDISMPKGSTVVDMASGVEYAVKAAEYMEIMQAAADQNSCTNAGMAIDQTITLPSSSVWTQPDHYNTDAPDAGTALVKVVEGVCVTEDAEGRCS
eukprot:TRINITY_DN3834_c0_g1_i3.p1 TRINITY_DN3834_c0_g1~~TRINITY_DN3834_c0_g1_i3.p1  ORF type:complete len:245 (+),score=62.90 TRINITY_DN3834_c0_g1_i3:181-915(+)